MPRSVPLVRPRTLLLIAGLVWLLAGGNILRIGVLDFIRHWGGHPVYPLCAVAILLLFLRLVFYPLVKRHTTRILGMSDPRVPVYLFFDRKSYCIMAVMIIGGLLLRMSCLLPPIAIGVCYSGIGAALTGAGLLFLQRYLRAARPPADQPPAPSDHPPTGDV